MNIDEMQAGREMDALIAEKVMGISVQTFGDTCYLVNYCLKKENGDLYYFNGECPTRASIEEAKKLIPRYSTDLAAAWEVEEKIIQLDFINEYLEALQIIVNGVERGWTMTGIIIGHTYTVEQTINLVHASPEQRCRAALKALGIELC
jgi:hypothetical protein